MRPSGYAEADLGVCSNLTLSSLNSTATTYTSVFEEISKYNVQLNYAERLWAVRNLPTLSTLNVDS